MSWYGGYASGRGPGEPTYSVGELTKEVKEVVGGSFRDFWVQGEIQRIHSSARGHLYFELVEKGVGDRIVGKLDAVVWRSEHERLRRLLSSEGHRLAAGQVVRCFGGLDFYPAGGRLQMIVRDLDPAFTLGDLERRRRATLGALEQAGLLDANAELDLPSVPLRLGLITSDGSAAQQDVLAGLRESGLGFRLLFVHTSVQGAGAEREIAEAIELLGRAALDGRPLDALLLVRGGGARTDLAAFDSRAVAFAVARCPRPVICGLGHQSDQTVADRVCHTSVKTPTKAAELMREVVDAAEQRLVAVRGGLIAASQRRLLRALQVLGRGERLARLARTRLESRRRAVDEAARRLELVARRRLERLAPRLAALEKSLGEGAQRSLARRRQ
ncbi:MAG: exodeoxyribonuclease VII large subunit, partial [Acidobacteriota bacterium]